MLRAPRGCGRVSAPTHRPPGLASRGDHGPGPEKECRPHTHRRRSFWKQGGGASFPSESRCPSQPSPGLASRPLHTRTRAHTRAQKHRPTCTSAPRIALALRGQVRGGDRRHWPLGCRGRIHRPPRAGPREGAGRGRRELCRSTSNPASGRKAGAGVGTPEPRAGKAKSRCPRRRGLVGLTEAGLRPRARGGGGGAGARAPTPPPCPAPSSTVLSAWLCPDPLEAEDGSWLLSDLVRQPFCGIKA